MFVSHDTLNASHHSGLVSRRELYRAALLAPATVIIATTAIRIEFLNQAAGGVLPSRELRDNGTPVTWRQWPWVDEQGWRRIFGPRDANGQPLTRALTEPERAQMLRDIRRAQAGNTLRAVVETWGLAQYVFVPIALLLGLSVLCGHDIRRWLRVLGGVAICVAIAAGVLVSYRGYLPSLGW